MSTTAQPQTRLYSLGAKQAIPTRLLHFPRLLYREMQPRCLPWFSAILDCSSLAVFCLSAGRLSKTASHSEKAASLSISNPSRTRGLLPFITHTGHIQGQGTGCKNSGWFVANFIQLSGLTSLAGRKRGCSFFGWASFRIRGEALYLSAAGDTGHSGDW